MKLSRPRRRAQPETITALIDVVFFLLVFFMLIGRMDATAPFEVLPAVSDTGTDMPGGGITVSLAADESVALDGRELNQAELEAALQARLEAEPGRLLRINAHKDASLDLVLPIAAVAEAAGARNIVLVVTPSSE